MKRVHVRRGLIFGLATLIFTLPVLADDDGCNKRKKYKKHHKHRSYYYDDDRYYDRDRYDDDDYYDDYDEDRRYHRRHYVYPRDVGFKIPHHMKYAPRYRNWYQGTRWHRSHNHRHHVYRFPVRYRGTWVYRDHPYCEGSLYRSGIGGSFDYYGRRVRLHIDFD